MERFFRFIASPAGRWTRIAVGTALATVALSRRGRRRVLLLPASMAVLTGVLDIVPPARLAGLPIEGAALRRRLGMEAEAPLLRSRSEHIAPRASGDMSLG